MTYTTADSTYPLQEDEESCCNKYSCCAPTSPIIYNEPKVGRNDPCPCDSGRKFKKCCG